MELRLFLIVLAAALTAANRVDAFAVHARPLAVSAVDASNRVLHARPSTVPSTARMGLFDAFKAAFANEKFSGRSAKASHILLKGANAGADARMVKARIESGELSFATAARQFSSCPSKAKGGSLGQFAPGQMVLEFDRVVFAPETKLTEIYTVETDFGTHLIKVEARTD